MLSNPTNINQRTNTTRGFSTLSTSPNSVEQNGAPKFRFEISTNRTSRSSLWWYLKSYPLITTLGDFRSIRSCWVFRHKSVCLQIKRTKSPHFGHRAESGPRWRKFAGCRRDVIDPMRMIDSCYGDCYMASFAQPRGLLRFTIVLVKYDILARYKFCSIIIPHKIFVK